MDRRADIRKLRDEALSHLTAEEAEQLGTKLPAGANHYRAWVGPPYNYDINGAMQFMMYIDFGLREYHRLLEIGCGSLRVGRLFMTYLLAGRYFGVEPNVAMLEEGLMANCGGGLTGDLVRAKRPKFAHNQDFDFSFTDGPVDFVVAQSIASHTGVSETRNLLDAISRVCHERTLAMVTFIRTENPAAQNTRDGWMYPETVVYTDQFIGNLGKELGFHVCRTRWPPINETPEGLITTQVPYVFTKTAWKPTYAHQTYGVRLHPVVRLA